MQVLYLGRAPRTKETLPDFLKWRRVTRPPLVFRGLTGSQRTPGFWGVTGTAAIMKETLDRLVATVENSKSKSSVTSTRTNLPGCSILDVLADVITLPGVDEKRDLYIFAT